MTDFEVVYAYGTHRENLLISRVYAVNDHDFLLADETGHFKWIPMRFCVLKSRWERHNDGLIPDKPTEDTLDSYDRIVTAGL